MTKRILACLEAIGSWIEYCVTRKCWMCGGKGEVEMYGLMVQCGECKGDKRL